MEIDANSSWQWMILMALLLGLRHGCNLDHLATIDAITRTMRDHKILSKMVGFLFSLGHGLVVTLISVIIGSGLMETNIPKWLDGFGNWVSFFFLLIFGALNLWSVFQKSSSTTMPVGIKSLLAKKITDKKSSPLLIIMIGSLFAISFDTFSQIALFSISASLLSGWIFSGILGIFFTIGMMLTDSLNGFLVSTLIQRADGTSVILSRGLGIAISMFSIGIAIIALLRLLQISI